ncbi:MAG: hypothetical protein KDC84_08715 [Crocinitomicaceae bacterium]|nr:hypothetical protein [Crocinitomicaceae bacterium]
MKYLVFLLLFLPFCGYSQKTAEHFGYSLEYRDSVYYLVDSIGNSDSIGKSIEVEIDDFKIALEKCQVPDRELIGRIADMYLKNNSCPNPNYYKQKAAMGQIAFINDCMAEYFIRKLISKDSLE